MTKTMTSVNIVNNEVLDTLNEFKDLWYNDLESFKKHAYLINANNEKNKREENISDAYKKKIMADYKDHDGYPECLYGYTFKQVKTSDYWDRTPRSDDDKIKEKYFNDNYIRLNKKLSSILSTRANALAAVYPPGGYIGWHNNANAPSYNIVLTWSETGDGYWKHVDPKTGEEVLVKDKVGWQAKGFYFGSYEDGPENLVYHMASTDCWRFTVSYVFDQTSKGFWEDVLEEIGIE